MTSKEGRCRRYAGEARWQEGDKEEGEEVRFSVGRRGAHNEMSPSTR